MNLKNIFIILTGVVLLSINVGADTGITSSKADEILDLLFIGAKVVGAIAIVMGIIELLIEKDQGGQQGKKVNGSMKLAGGVLLLLAASVIDWMVGSEINIAEESTSKRVSSKTNTVPKIKAEDSSKENIAKAIAESSASTKTTNDAVIKYRETSDKIKAINANPDNSMKVKMCGMREELLSNTGSIAKTLRPAATLIMVILAMLGIKKLFLDNPEQQPNGLSTNVMKGSMMLFFAYLLAGFDDLVKWWEERLIPDFSSLCEGGKDNALQLVIIKEMLYFIFVIVQFLGVIAILMGITDLLKKDRAGGVNVYGVGTKILGGLLLVQYKWVLDFFGIIDIT